MTKHERNIAAPQLLSVRRCAELLCCSKSHVYLLIEQNKLPSFKLENMVRVYDTDLKAYIDKWHNTSTASADTGMDGLPSPAMDEHAAGSRLMREVKRMPKAKSRNSTAAPSARS